MHHKKKIFLSWLSLEEDKLRNSLKNTLEKAGIEVYPKIDYPANEEEFYSEVNKAIEVADGSVNIISNNFGQTLSQDYHTSFSKYQFQEARKRLENDQDFKMFIWHPEELLENPPGEIQHQFITEIRHSIIENMIFTNTSSEIQLVNDIRLFLDNKEDIELDVNPADIFVMFNQLDEEEASEVTDMLSDIISVRDLNVIQDSETNYAEL